MTSATSIEGVGPLGQVLIKRFVTEKHHKIMMVADAGRNMTASAHRVRSSGTWPPTSSARWG